MTLGWLEAALVNNLWLALLTWAVVYSLDYYLTIYGARLYQDIGSKYMAVEGSYEMTPYFQADVNALRRVSPRFFTQLLFGAALLTVAWLLAVRTGVLPEVGPQMFSFILGGVLLRGLFPHTRHIRSIVVFQAIRNGRGIRGRVEQSRWLAYRMLTAELLSFAALLSIGFAITGSWFFAGGGLFSAAEAFRSWRMGRKASPDFANPETDRPKEGATE